MILSMTAADELASLRSQIRKLARREAALRHAFAAGELPMQGMSARIEVIVQTQTVFCPERLPGRVLTDLRYWTEEVTERVDVIARTEALTLEAAPLYPPRDLRLN